ncbi:MAG TPA: hypothetical protein DEF51_46470, partial [Myxococcales bacterium]|nr:hypothetical protein [Myxococcales bacterium]
MRWLAIALLFVACDGAPAPGEGGVSPGRDAGPPGVPVPRSGLPVGADDALRLVLALHRRGEDLVVG